MDRIIYDSFLKLDNIYIQYPILDSLAVNSFQLLTFFWNIFLALLPLLFYRALKSYWRRTGLKNLGQKFLALILFIFWLLFFPNTAYLITDVRHLLDYCPINSPDRVCVNNAWMIIFFFVYGCLGWLSFYYILKSMSSLINKIFKKISTNFFVCIMIPLTSFGILFGLLNRLNSWDIFVAPIWIFKAFIIYFLDLNYFMDWFIFTIFLYLLYFSGDYFFKKIKI